MIPAPLGRGLSAAALLLGAALAASSTAAAVLPGGLVVRSAGRAPVLSGRVDTAYAQALDEAFRRAVLEALRQLFPARQSADDLGQWQDTILSRASTFVGAWRILAHERRDGFVALEVEVEVWRSQLESAVAAPATAARLPARIVVFADPYPVDDPAADEDVDAGWYAIGELEAEFARRGAVVLSTINRAPWIGGDWADTAENRAAVSAAEARRLEADAALIVRVTPRGKGLSLAVRLVGAFSEVTLGETRGEVDLPGEGPLSPAFTPAARHAAAALAPRLDAARLERARDTARPEPLRP